MDIQPDAELFRAEVMLIFFLVDHERFFIFYFLQARTQNKNASDFLLCNMPNVSCKQLPSQGRAGVDRISTSFGAPMHASQPSHPIGVFDSGVGGLTVVRALMDRLPFENIIYFGDTARVPYGVKSVATIEHFTQQIADFLLKQQVKVLIIACNTMAAVIKDVIFYYVVNNLEILFWSSNKAT